MFTYRAYGLGIHSELALSGLITAPARRDVVVQWGQPSTVPAEANGTEPYLRLNSLEAVLALPGLGTFVLCNGNEISIFPHPAADARVLERHIVGNLLAMLLYQRGYLVLHASTAKIDGWAVAFLGEAGTGKSSTAAALCSQGHDLLADDAAVLPRCDPPALVVPGFPQLKLSPEVARVLGYPYGALDESNAVGGKLFLRVGGGSEVEPATLQRMYVLERGGEFLIERLSAHQAVVEFVRHSVPIRFQQPGDASHFENCLRLARWLPTFRLRVPHGLEYLPRLAREIEHHCRHAHLERDA